MHCDGYFVISPPEAASSAQKSIKQVYLSDANIKGSINVNKCNKCTPTM